MATPRKKITLFKGQILNDFFFQTIVGALNRATVGRTSIAIAHRLSTVMDADEILVLEGGRIVERGTHDELVSRPDSLYSLMWTTQQGSRPLKAERAQS